MWLLSSIPEMLISVTNGNDVEIVFEIFFTVEPPASYGGLCGMVKLGFYGRSKTLLAGLLCLFVYLFDQSWRVGNIGPDHPLSEELFAMALVRQNDI